MSETNNLKEQIKTLEKQVKTLKKQVKDLRKKNRILRKENKLMLENAKKYPCCKHLDKRGFSLKQPYNPGKHKSFDEDELKPEYAYCQECDNMKPLYFGEIMDTEMKTRCVWICTKCTDVDSPCSFGPEYKILCKACLIKRKKVKEKNESKKRKRENEEWRRIQKRNEDHNNRLLY